MMISQKSFKSGRERDKITPSILDGLPAAITGPYLIASFNMGKLGGGNGRKGITMVHIIKHI